MSKHIHSVEAACDSCDTTGLYKGMGEGGGIAVVCTKCKGTGHYTLVTEWEDFTSNKKRKGVKRVVQVNPGIYIGEGNGHSLESWGGVSYKEWLATREFPPGSENRKATCPAWWYQSADYDRKPPWKECMIMGSFSGCQHFDNKVKCWARFDEEGL